MYSSISFLITLTMLQVNLASEQQVDITLNDDPSLFPGHMEPLGSKQPRTEIKELTQYPSPTGLLD